MAKAGWRVKAAGGAVPVPGSYRRLDTSDQEGDRQWREQAVCAQTDPELWYPDKGDSGAGRKAVALCRTCPVQRDCLTYALIMGEDVGIFGGFTPRARRPFVHMVKQGAAPSDVAIAAIHAEQVFRECG